MTLMILSELQLSQEQCCSPRGESRFETALVIHLKDDCHLCSGLDNDWHAAGEWSPGILHHHCPLLARLLVSPAPLWYLEGLSEKIIICYPCTRSIWLCVLPKVLPMFKSWHYAEYGSCGATLAKRTLKECKHIECPPLPNQDLSSSGRACLALRPSFRSLHLRAWIMLIGEHDLTILMVRCWSKQKDSFHGKSRDSTHVHLPEMWCLSLSSRLLHPLLV